MKTFSNNSLSVKNFDMKNARSILAAAKTIKESKASLKALKSEVLTTLFHYYIIEKRETVFSLVLAKALFNKKELNNFIDYLEINGIRIALHKIDSEKLHLPKKLNTNFSKVDYENYLEKLAEKAAETRKEKQAEKIALANAEAEEKAAEVEKVKSDYQIALEQISTLKAENEALKAELATLKTATKVTKASKAA